MQQLTSIPTSTERLVVGLDDSGISIGDLLGTLRSRLPLIAACSVACLLCSLVYLRITKPTYEGAATIRIDPGRAGSLGLSDLGVTGTSDTDDDLHTEIAVLKSDGVALRTLRSLSDADFLSMTGVSKPAAAIPDSIASLSPSQQEILNRFEGNTEAKVVEGTSLVTVSVRASSPRTAANVTNSLVNAYIVQSFTSRDKSVAELRTWLSAQMATLKDQVDSAQKKLAEFQEANDIIGTAGGLNDGNTVTDRLRILNQSLATAESDRIEKEARLRAAATADPSVLATLFPDATLNALQASQVELQGRAAQLSSKFGPKYPPLAEVNKQLTAINLQVMQSEGAVRQRLQQEYDAAKAVQDMLQKEYAAQTQVAFGVNRNQAEYAVLQGDVTTSRELYDLLRRKMQQASVDADISGLKTVPVDASRIPTEPVAPKRLLILLGSAILGLFAGVAAAFVGEATSDQVQTRRQVEADLGIPVLALLPRDGGPVSSLVTLRRSSSRDAEAYRALRTAVLAMPSAKSIMVASSLPNEGLGRVVANLAVSLAQAGHRVLAVDTDLRSPSLHNEFDIDNNAGLSNVLMNEDVKGALLHPLKDLGDLSLLPAGPPIAFPSERLSSEFFRALLKSWENDFDFVILQAAPLLIVSDGVSVAGLADSVLLIARHEVTRLSNLTQVKLLLDRSSARVRGVVIGDVPAVNMDYASYEKVGNAYFA